MHLLQGFILLIFNRSPTKTLNVELVFQMCLPSLSACPHLPAIQTFFFWHTPAYTKL